MNWPWMSRALAESLIQAERTRADNERAWREYWQKRAEHYIDLDRSSAGVAHMPVMADRPVAEQDALSAAFAGAAMMEFDSTKGR